MRFHFVRHGDLPDHFHSASGKRDADTIFCGTVASGHGHCSDQPADHRGLVLDCPERSGIARKCYERGDGASILLDLNRCPRISWCGRELVGKPCAKRRHLAIWILKIHDKNALHGFLLQVGRKLMGQRGECLHAGWPRFLLQRRRRKGQQRSNHDGVNHNCEAEWME